MIKLLCIDHVTKIVGGAEINLLQLLEKLDQTRFEAGVACVKDGMLDAQLRRRQLTCHYFAVSSVVSEFRLVQQSLPIGRAVRSINVLRDTAVELRNIALKTGAQLLLSVTNKDHFAAGIAARKLKLPSIWWVNDIICRDFFSPMILLAFAMMARRYATHLVTVSEEGREALIKLGIAPKRVTTIYNGIDPEIYRPVDGSQMRAEFAVSPTAKVMTIIGRVTQWKGQHIFLEAARVLMERYPDLHCWIVGGIFNEDQQYAENLLNIVKNAGLMDRIKFIPFREDIAEVCSASNLVVHCSLKPEAFGRVIIEAMSSAVPVVAAQDGGVAEIISNNINGLMVQPGDVAGYISAIDSLLSNDQRAREIGAAGRENVLARFTLTRLTTEFERLIEQTVIKEKR